MNKSAKIIVVGIAVFFLLIIALVSRNEDKKKEYYQEQKTELSRVEKKLTELTLDIKSLTAQLKSIDSKLSKSTTEVSRYNEGIDKMKKMYNDYLDALELYNRTSDSIKEKLEAKGMSCGFCTKKMSEYDFTFE